MSVFGSWAVLHLRGSYTATSNGEVGYGEAEGTRQKDAIACLTVCLDTRLRPPYENRISRRVSKLGILKITVQDVSASVCLLCFGIPGCHVAILLSSFKTGYHQDYRSGRFGQCLPTLFWDSRFSFGDIIVLCYAPVYVMLLCVM
jgi:hypothetical protein